jgi:hypothetical protein
LTTPRSPRTAASWERSGGLRRALPRRQNLKLSDRKYHSLPFELRFPDYLDRELALKAVDQRVTKQYLVMKALQAAGYKLDDADLVEDKRKQKKR